MSSSTRNGAFRMHKVVTKATVKELKQQLRDLRLPVSGNKAQLLERLKQAETPVEGRNGGAVAETESVPSETQTSVIAEIVDPRALEMLDPTVVGERTALIELFKIVETTETASPEQLAATSEALLNQTAYNEALRLRRQRAATGTQSGPASKGQVEKAHMFLLGYASNLRQKRAGKEVSVILQRAIQGEDALDAHMKEMIRDARVDETLVHYVVSIVDKEALKCGISSPPLPRGLQLSNGFNPGTGSTRVGPKKLDAAPSPLLQVLTIVRNRVVAEFMALSTGGDTNGESSSPNPSSFSKILARVVRFDDIEERASYLKTSLLDRRTARAFMEFAESGAEYLQRNVETEMTLSFAPEAIELGDAPEVTQRIKDALTEKDNQEGGGGRMSSKLRNEREQAKRVGEIANQIRVMIFAFPVNVP